MQLADKTWQFDTDQIDAAVQINEQQRDWYQRDMLNAFTRYAYYRYKQVRDQVNKRKCKHMTIDKVEEQLQEASTLEKVCGALFISAEEVHYIVNHARRHLKYIK